MGAVDGPAVGTRPGRVRPADPAGVAWYIGVGSGQWVPGVTVAVVVLAVLALLFSPSALQWAAAQGSPAADDAASADKSGPDTR